MTTRASSLALLAVLIGLSGCSSASPAGPAQTASRLRTQAIGGPSELLVKFKVPASPDLVERFGSKYGLRRKEVIAAIDVHVMTILTGEEAASLADRVEASSLVVYAEPNHRLSMK